MLYARKNQLKNAINSNRTFIEVNAELPIHIVAIELAFLESNVEAAISFPSRALRDGYISPFPFKQYPIYQEMREQPKWPELIAS